MVHVMSEIQRYLVDPIRLDNPSTARAVYVVGAADFDAQRLRADTAEAAFEEGQANWVLCMETLRAAEQRIADLVGLLSRSKKAVDDVAENCEDQRDWQEANSMRALSLKIDAALNPNPEAESHGRIPD